MRRAWLERLAAATGRLVDELQEHDAPALRRLRRDIGDLHARVAAELAADRRDHPRLLVFLCGTTLMSGDGNGDHLSGYVATADAVERLRGWSDQGAEISYLSAHRDAARLAASAGVLRERGFPAGAVLSRVADETYDDVVRRAGPDVLIEDDCRSTGPHDIAYHQIATGLQERVRSIVVPEFGGLGHLPADLGGLLAFTA